MEDIKGRVWAFVLYPESCAYDYLDMIKRLEQLKIPMAVSPLHIPSKNIECENEKKEHYHVLFYLDGAKKKDDLKKLIDYGSSSYDRQYFCWDLLIDKKHISKKKALYPYFLKVNSITAYFRYLIHLDNPQKQQFQDYKISNFVVDDEQKYNNIVLLNGFNERDYLKNSDSNPDFVLLDIIKENRFVRIQDLMFYLRTSKNIFLLNYIKKNMMWCKCCLFPDLFNYGYKENNKAVEDIINEI